MMMRVRIEIQLIDDDDRLDDVAAGGTRRERLADFGRLRPGRPEGPVPLQDRRQPVLELTAVEVPRRKWWQRR